MFDNLNDILFHKRKDRLDNVDNESEYNQYMVNRWVSMHSAEAAHVINATVNWLYPVFEDKQRHYKFLTELLPRYRKKYIQYIKKAKPVSTDADSDESNVDLLADTLELSRREVKYLVQQQNERKHRSNNTN